MRKRSRSIPISRTFLFSLDDWKRDVSISPVTPYLWNYWEYMDDNLGYGPNSVWHDKSYGYDCPQITASVFYNGSGVWVVDGHSTRVATFSKELFNAAYALSASYCSTTWFSGYDWDLGIGTALRDTQPRFQPSINMLNFFRELKDAKELFHSSVVAREFKRHDRRVSLGQNFTSIYANNEKRKRFYKLAKKKGYSKEDARTFINSLSSDVLCWSFGWLPTILDILTLVSVKGPAYWHDKMLAAKEIGQESIPIRFDGKFSREIPRGDSQEFILNTYSVGYVRVRGRQSSSMNIHAYGKYRWTTADYDPIVDYWKQFSSEIGLHCIAGTVWEAIPWSFFIDYFIPIGKLFDRVDSTGDYSPTMELVECMYSTKEQHGLRVETIVFDWIESYRNNSDFSVNFDGSGFVSRNCVYARNNASPQDYRTYMPWLVPGKGITAGNRMITSLALLAQVLSKR